MASIRLLPNTIFGRSRNEPEILVATAANAGAVTDPTKLTLTVVDQTPGFVYDTVNKEIDLPAKGVYLILVRLYQVGASAVVDIYDVTGTASLVSSQLGEGEKLLWFYLRTTTAKSIAIRVDDQDSNDATAGTNQITVYRVGKVF